MAERNSKNLNRNRSDYKPKTKEDAIREMFEKNPEQAAKLLREILKGSKD